MYVQMLDEMLPKATGKEARFEKKRIRAEKRREREISPGSYTTMYVWLEHIHDMICRNQF